MLDSRMASRLRIGSALLSTRPSSAATVPAMRSRMASPSVAKSRPGAARLPRMLTGTPASEPGVKMVRSTVSSSVWMRSGADAPVGQAVAPQFGSGLGKFVDRLSLATSVVDVDPGLEVVRQQVGELQQQVGDVALGIDEDGRHAIQRGLFQQTDAEAGLAAAGHAHADGVGGQIAGIVVDRLRR